VIRKDRGVI